MRKYSLFLFMIFLSSSVIAEDTIWYRNDDPLNIRIDHLPRIPNDYKSLNHLCDKVDLSKPMTLAEVVNTSLCNNPLTSEIWESTRVQAAQLGIAKSAYLPSLTDNISTSLNVLDPEPASRSNPYLNLSNSLVANYLLYDFGNRKATIENARQLLLAASASQSSIVQSLLLTSTVAFYQVLASNAALDAAIEAERASQESFNAAEARYKAGVSTPADKLQAQTAYAQLKLRRITSEGNLKTAYGNLANIMGLAANKKISLAMSAASTPPKSMIEDINLLIEKASTMRPDLIASEARFKAAQANIEASKAAAKPTISVSMVNSFQDGSSLSFSNNATIGLTVSIPIFNGYAPTYRVRAAEAAANLQAAQRDRLKLQISLDVWTAYQNLKTALESVTATEALASSAEQSHHVALGRYKAGVGNIIDTLNAQSALANARQQKIQAFFNANIARATLAQAMGTLDNAMIQSLPATNLTELTP